MMSFADKPHVAMRAALRDRSRLPMSSAPSGTATRLVRTVALAGLGLAVGVGGTVFGVSLVQANDGADMYEVIRHDERQRRARQAAPAAPIAVYASHAATAYAPARAIAPQPLSIFNSRGQLVIPNFSLNPFNPTGDERAQRLNQRQEQRARRNETDFGFHVVSGAAGSTRTICVRLCDGYHHPIGFLGDSSDLAGHEALCRATFPGVPTRVFRVAAGADTIDDAVASDGRTYRALPMAYAYQTSIDPACARPRRGEHTISIFKDFTLRPGDTVVTNGRPRVFMGSQSYPYTMANFRDFGSTNQISRQQRREIDDRLGISRQEQLRREARRLQRVREANAASAIDVVRGGTEIAGGRGNPAVRVIDLPRRTP
jgi:hypothetical protein